VREEPAARPAESSTISRSDLSPDDAERGSISGSGRRVAGHEEATDTARRDALTIALSYVVGGLVPLAPYFVVRSTGTALVISVFATLLA
jgi:VIT1/CCC1 family predicted Fe2+/Mn2+ transporter